MSSQEIKQTAVAEHEPEETARRSRIRLSPVTQTCSVPVQGFTWREEGGWLGPHEEFQLASPSPNGQLQGSKLGWVAVPSRPRPQV